MSQDKPNLLPTPDLLGTSSSPFDVLRFSNLWMQRGDMAENLVRLRSLLSSLLLFTVVSSGMSLKNAVVTGANRGIGLELCKQMSGRQGSDRAFDTIYALCRKTSDELTSLAKSASNVQIVDGIEVTKEESQTKLQKVFRTNDDNPVGIDLLIHNAGAYGPPRNYASAKELYVSQSLESIDVDTMRYALELNTFAPLFVTKALLKNLKRASKENGMSKVIVISSSIGSIAENGSGNHYAYRTAKAGVNMVGKTLSVDLKDDKVAVGLVHPGYVYTGFGGDKERREGQRDVDESVRGVLQAIDQVGLDNSGCFLHGNYGEGVKPVAW